MVTGKISLVSNCSTSSNVHGREYKN